MIEFNINHYVQVKLTEVGLNALKEQHEELKKTVPGIGDFKEPKVDKEGFSKWQLHSLMSSLGPLCRLGFEPPFETTIRIDTKSE